MLYFHQPFVSFLNCCITAELSTASVYTNSGQVFSKDSYMQGLSTVPKGALHIYSHVFLSAITATLKTNNV